MSDKLALFYVYDDDTPYIVRNPPANFGDLLTGYNRQYNAADDGKADDPGNVTDWLRERGVDIVYVPEGPGGDVWILDDYQPDAN